jgi:hypothetical protein
MQVMPHGVAALKINQRTDTGSVVRKARWERYSPRWLAPYTRRLRWLIAAGGVLALTIVLIGLPSQTTDVASPNVPSHPLASHAMPPFITAPGASDVLLVCMAIVLIVAVMAVGVFFFWLHSLPERLVHNSTKVHFDIVAVLGLLSLFTHVHLFWVAALLLALVKMPQWSIPDFSGLLSRIAGAIEGISRVERRKNGADLRNADKRVPESRELSDA